MAVSAEKPLESAISTMTCTLTSVATANCRTGTAVDNSTNRYRRIWVAVHTKSQGTPAVDTVCEVWGLRSDANTTAIADGGYADDTAYTLALRPRGGTFLGYLAADGSATPVLQGVFKFDDPGVKWNILVVNSLGQTLSATGSDHVVTYRGENPEMQ
jgi:hypothetical protein